MRTTRATPRCLSDRGTHGLLQLHRGLLQSYPTALRPGVSLAHLLRTGDANRPTVRHPLNRPPIRGNFRHPPPAHAAPRSPPQSCLGRQPWTPPTHRGLSDPHRRARTPARPRPCRPHQASRSGALPSPSRRRRTSVLSRQPWSCPLVSHEPSRRLPEPVLALGARLPTGHPSWLACRGTGPTLVLVARVQRWSLPADRLARSAYPCRDRALPGYRCNEPSGAEAGGPAAAEPLRSQACRSSTIPRAVTTF